MCFGCVESSGGLDVVLNDHHKEVASWINEWYDAPDENDEGYTINALGGGLHIQLDDYNLDDDCLIGYDWKSYSVWDFETKNYSRIKRSHNYSAATLELGDKIVTALIEMSEPERNAVVGYAHGDTL